MKANPPRGTLPIRRWLALALLSVFFVPAAVTGVVVYHLLGAGANGASVAADRLRAGVAEWNDPAWQTATKRALAAQGVDFVLIENGREIYRSSPDPLAGTSDQGSERLAQEISIPGAGAQHAAVIYSNQNHWPPGGSSRPWLLPLAFLITMLLMLGTIAWLLGRIVVRPLAAASDAARQIAAGNLDVDLPSSRVREVAQVNTALAAMSGALKESLEQQAAEEQQRRFFIGAVVHDLRTPLFALRGYLEGLEQGLADTPEKRRRYVAVAQEKAAALERLIADLFTYTRLEYLDQAPSPAPLDLAALLRRLVDGLQPQAAAKGVSLALADSATRCTVDADAHLLTRAVENLLDNALRYTPAGGNVRVACGASPAGVTFTVSDTGPGIPPHDLPHLFQPLYRGETSRNRRTGGAGLGLTIARRILLAHGGDLTARNGLAGGAVFTGTLPAPAGGPPPVPEPAAVSVG